MRWFSSVRSASRRRGEVLMAMCASVAGVCLLAFGPLEAAAGQGSPSPPARAAAAVPPDELFSDLAKIDRELGVLDRDLNKHALSQDELVRRIHTIIRQKEAIVERFFDQEMYGVKASEVILKIDCISTALHRAESPVGAGMRERLNLLSTAARCKDALERDLRKSVETPEALLAELQSIDKDLSDAEKAERSGHTVTTALLEDIHYRVYNALPRRFFTQGVYGGGKSEMPLWSVIIHMALLDEELDSALADPQYAAAGILILAQRVNQRFERELEDAVPPTLAPIQAVFTPAPAGQSCSPPYCTTVYTEAAHLRQLPLEEGLHFVWVVAIPADPGCAAGFHPNTPHQDDATWYHADASEGGPCNHSGNTYNASGYGHPGLVIVSVSNNYWSCSAAFFGTQGANGAPTGDGPEPQPCQPR